MSETIARWGGYTLHSKPGKDYAFALRARNLPKSYFTLRFDGHKIANSRESYELLKLDPTAYRRAEAILQSRLTAKGRHDLVAS